MDKKVSLKEVYAAYKRWVINNPTLVSDVETMATWSSYLVVSKVNKSTALSELVYSLSKLLSLFNDKLIREAYGGETQYCGLSDQIKLWLTVIHYCEVLAEVAVNSKWGHRGKWTAATIIQFVKCSSALILLLRYKEVPISHPPILALQRKKFTEGKQVECESDSYFTLKRSGRVVRRVDGSPPAAFRDWQPLNIKDDSLTYSHKDIIYAECIHIMKPMIHLAAMRVFGTKAWKQWLVALSMDVASLRLYGRHMKHMTYDQRLEVSRRKLGLVLYLLRTPMYNGYSKHVIESFLNSLSKKIPLMDVVSGVVIQHLKIWQEIYFYMWSS